MCLGIPGKVIKTWHEHDVLMGKVDFGGVCKSVCLEHVRDVRLGQYVLVHVGFALSKIDEEEAVRVFEFLEKMNQLEELGEAKGFRIQDSGSDHGGPLNPEPRTLNSSGGVQ